MGQAQEYYRWARLREAAALSITKLQVGQAQAVTGGPGTGMSPGNDRWARRRETAAQSIKFLQVG